MSHALRSRVRFTVKLTAVALSLGMLAGCASWSWTGYSDEFSCDQTDVACTSATNVYEQTNGSNWDHSQNDKNGKTDKGDTSIVLAPYSDKAGLSMPGINSPKPIRTPAQIMRIYMAPWVGRDGDLTMPSYVYTEITPRRWTVGQDVSDSDARNLYPLQVARPDSGDKAGSSNKGG